jgi:hypothetical protein
MSDFGSRTNGKMIFTYGRFYGGVVGMGIYSVSSNGFSLLAPSPIPISVAVASSKIYYTDWTIGGLPGNVSVFTP